MESIATFAILAAIGIGAYYSSSMSLLKEKEDKAYAYRPFPTGFEELSNQVIDPGNIKSDSAYTPIIKTEEGPFGVPRNIHLVPGTRGDIFTSFGTDPGIHTNI